MSGPEDGAGPAFPSETAEKWYLGMTLRDYFAGQVIATFAERIESSGHAARLAYQIADAMLEAREVTP